MGLPLSKHSLRHPLSILLGTSSQMDQWLHQCSNRIIESLLCSGEWVPVVMEMPFTSRLCLASLLAVPLVPSQLQGGGLGPLASGKRLLAGVTGVLDLIIRVLCAF